MPFPQEIDSDLVLAVAKRYHERSEAEYEESERVPFDQLDEDDLEFLLYEAQQWLETIAAHLREQP